ncbi:hypothetical protein PQU92_09205 [Asticcacaulis sp. BYS171W]|uniref:PE-PGRS family protein n=1 Tax=Asticcacaulis aquaticus TaxID=2984212 RepID=A0ABT5HU56_9CAUL|nr:hypothetical protein [Asticcacaulis aquaticus]MDC7683452.1 hypothetical protein [Asticcacaulis aquaticus]
MTANTFDLNRRACLGGLIGAAIASAVRAQDAMPTLILVSQTANLRQLADQQGYDGRTPTAFDFVVPDKVVIMGAPGGKPGIDTGLWPEGVKIRLIIRGHVYGGGGNGGDGGDIPGPTEGGRGGDAIALHTPITLVILPSATVKGGGGGGAGGPGGGNGGSGGGGGFPNGNRGAAGTGVASEGSSFSDYGRPGTPGGGGAAGARGNAGGAGGNAGLPGGNGGRPGGPAGKAVNTNGNHLRINNQGQVFGDVS